MNPAFIADIRQKIAAIKEAYPEILEDVDLLQDMLEGSTGIDRLISAFVLEIKSAEGKAEGLQAVASKIADRARKSIDGAEKLRSALKAFMLEAGVKSMSGASISSGRAAVIWTDEDAVPDAFCKIVTTRKPDKAAAKTALENGIPVPGAALTNPEPVLRIM